MPDPLPRTQCSAFPAKAASSLQLLATETSSVKFRGASTRKLVAVRLVIVEQEGGLGVLVATLSYVCVKPTGGGARAGAGSAKGGKICCVMADGYGDGVLGDCCS
jgi:hypothetical protein